MVIVTGIVAGIVSSLGMGGGTVLILILSNFLGINQHVSQAVNLFFFIPTALVISFINFKQKIIDIKLGALIAFFGVIGAIIGANLSLKIDSSNLKKYFGIFLLIIAIYEIYNILMEYRKTKFANNTKDEKKNRKDEMI